MEAYRTLFPGSSSVSSDSLNMVNSNDFSEFENHRPNNNSGFLGLMANMGMNYSNSSPDSSAEAYPSTGNLLLSAGGGGTRDLSKLVNKKSKGEKKIKKPKYAFQTRSQVDILDDGYRWRKYGQKAVKNNKFPRSYYRCTHQGCNVKKQVQRLSRDEEVVVTTYEGMHSHPIEKSTDNFEHILSQMQIYTSF